MMIKEYRIPLPLSVEEYRIAQLYMIQKKSRQESNGEGSGVEILINEPYGDGPGGGNGQYTRKLYHVGSHLPGWFRSILPKSALMVEEEAWNAYPYTKTRYTCPFVEKFSLEIETRYLGDKGNTDNVFNLPSKDLKTRVVDHVDVVNDQMWPSDYLDTEDPTLFVSEKTGRGPLDQAWIDDADTIMCAYKLCKVEFRYWGMQSKIEKFIHDVGLRKTMLRAHRQAWAWQDEWHGLTIADIRRLEQEAQEELAQRMRQFAKQEEDRDETLITNTQRRGDESPNRVAAVATTAAAASVHGDEVDGAGALTSSSLAVAPPSYAYACATSTPRLHARREQPCQRLSHISDRQDDSISWRMNMNAIARDDDDEDSLPSIGEDDLFFDAREPDEVIPCNFPIPSSTSMEFLQIDDEEEEEDEDCISPAQSFRTLDTVSTTASFRSCPDDEDMDHFFENDLQNCDDDDELLQEILPDVPPKSSLFASRLLRQRDFRRPESDSSPLSAGASPKSIAGCRTTVLILVFHGGSVLDTAQDSAAKTSDTATFQTTMTHLLTTHYPAAVDHISIRHVSCPPLCARTLTTLAHLNPFGLKASSPLTTSFDPTVSCHDAISIGIAPLLSTLRSDFEPLVDETIGAANDVFRSFLSSEQGTGFNGQVSIVGDSNGGLFAYEALRRGIEYVGGSMMSLEGPPFDFGDRNSPSSFGGERRSSVDTGASSSETVVIPAGTSLPTNPFFASNFKAGSPNTGLQLHNAALIRRGSASSEVFASLANMPTLSGEGGGGAVAGLRQPRPTLLFDAPELFLLGSPLALMLLYRQLIPGSRSSLPMVNFQVYNLFFPSDPSAVRLEPLLHDQFVQSPPITVPRYHKFPLGDGTSNTVNLAQWWGSKRIDYSLYSPEALRNFPPAALPHLFHASYWESYDVSAFVIRQILKMDPLNEDSVYTVTKDINENFASLLKGPSFQPGQAREKWLRKRTSVKLKNVNANHRANDVICAENCDQTLSGRFMYGPLDMVALTGEKVDVHIQSTPPQGDWIYYGTATTDSSGRLSYTIPEEKRLPQGVYPVKMVVRGDHTCVDFYLTVLPPSTECVVFSIDGSFTASVSIWGKDPKVRAGAIDVVRFWRDLGYLIIYITARPDMQKRKVVSWLAQHNFPHGMVAFMDGISTDPLRQKMAFLQRLKEEAQIVVKAAYGSAKDIVVYQGVQIEPSGIFVVGKASKKQSQQANIISEGYATHLAYITEADGDEGRSIKPTPATGNTQLFVRKGYFNHFGGSTSASPAVPTNASLRLHRSISARRKCSSFKPAEQSPKT